MRFSEIVNIAELKELWESFTTLTDVATAILDLEGNILVATGWQDICTRFHRVHPATACRCRESDTVLAGRLGKGEPYNVYLCRNGLVDVAVPIIVGGEHVANFFTGQFLFEPPDRQYFIRQAEEFSFDKTAYLEALSRVPIFSKNQVEAMMGFFSRLVRLIGEMGLSRKNLDEANTELRIHKGHLEELVRERTADLNRAQEIAHIGSWRWNLESDEVGWSNEMYRVFGLRPGEPARVTRETFLSRVREEERDSVAARLDEAMTAGQPFSFELRTVPIEGRERTVRVFAEVRRDAGGRPVELFGANQDITEEKHAQQLLAEAKERAEVANRAKSAFLASMSHELRTPLNAVLGFSQLMKSSRDVSPAQLEDLDIISQSGEHLLHLINNVLDISKIEAGHVMLEETRLDLHRLLHETRSLMSVRADQKGLGFAVNQAPDLPRCVAADSGKLRQVLLNLLGNAIKYTSAGDVSLRADVASREAPGKAWVRFEIEDSGPGIAREERERIFLPFVRLGEHAPVDAGTGLGLAISKQYVELMGGRIGVESEPDKGSVFHLEVPVTVLPANAIPVDAPQGRVTGLAENQPRRRLLIAEDQRENRMLLHRLIEPMGFSVREAVDGREALALFHQWHPDLIWMDVRMPVMDGLEATRRIRATDAGARTKIIAVTAHALEEERHEILAAGCDDLIRKPYRQEEIFETLAKHLGVQFQYAEEQATATGGQANGLDAARLGSLPPALIEELLKAAELLDGRHCLELADRIACVDQELGECLRRMVKNLEYKRLLAVLDTLVAEEAT